MPDWHIAQSPPPPCWNVNVADLFALFEPLPTVFENCDTVQVVVWLTLGTVQVLVSASIVSRQLPGGVPPCHATLIGSVPEVHL